MRLSYVLPNGVRINVVLAAAFCLCAQEPAKQSKDARPSEAQGLPPRAAPTDYQAQARAGALTIAADFVGHSVPHSTRDALHGRLCGGRDSVVRPARNAVPDFSGRFFTPNQREEDALAQPALRAGAFIPQRPRMGAPGIGVTDAIEVENQHRWWGSGRFQQPASGSAYPNRGAARDGTAHSKGFATVGRSRPSPGRINLLPYRGKAKNINSIRAALLWFRRQFNVAGLQNV